MKRRLSAFAFLLATVYSLLFTPLALADTVFFAFAPDAWASTRFLAGSAAEPLYQLFSVNQDVQLTGIDLWVDNTGSAGAVTFTLFSETDELFTKTVTVPQLSALPGGHKFHVTIAAPVTLASGGTYSLNIASELPGFALYSADRILAVEHNKTVTGTIGYGAAKIGSALQPFTFKLALYSPNVSGASYNNDQATPVYTDTPPEESPATTTIPIAITNARIASVTDTSVTLAWTTNIASDSRVAIRTQLSPLFVVTTATDPTWELEHTVAVEGLLANVNYFADVFSTQGDLVVLTTYTLGFKTELASEQPLENTNTNNSQNNQSNSNAPSSNNSSVSNQSQSQNSNQGPQNNQAEGSSSESSQNPSSAAAGPAGTSGFSNLNEITATESGGINTNISWPSSGLEGTEGYRIDVFDANHHLERSIVVDKDTYQKNVPGLTSGTHYVVVYEKTAEGTFAKVGPEKEIVIMRTEIFTKLAVGGGILLLIILIAIYVIWKFKKEKTILPPEEGYNPEQY